MKISRLLAVAAIPGVIYCSAQAMAAVTPEEAQQLKTTLTPLGAEKAGNAGGTIPAWTGGDSDATGLAATKNAPDKFSSDAKVVTINASNVAQYASKLPAGALALMKLYPTWHIDVYPTHRTGGAAPAWVYANTFQNATRAQLRAPNAVTGAFGGIPFPIPKDGREIVWNNNLHWEGTASFSKYSTYVVPSGGRPSLSGTNAVSIYKPYYDPKFNVDNYGGMIQLIRIQYSEPANRDGEEILAWNPANLDAQQEMVWQYLTGQRRLRRAPNLAYDGVYPDCGGFMNTDENRVFFYQTDRYNMKIIGKREMYIPYNVNKLQNYTPSAVMKPNFVDPDAVRWELHRVWDVDMTLVPGARHVVPHRHVYFDEDTWEAVAADEYDTQGRLWKFNVAYMYNQPTVPTVFNGTGTIYDLTSGGYCLNQYGYTGSNREYDLVAPQPMSFFQPDTVAADASR